MASVGSISFFSIRGEPSPPGENMVDVTRHGVDGTGLQLTGKRGAPFQIVGVQHVVSAAAAQTLEDDCADLMGSIQTITRDNGTTRTGVAIHDSRSIEVRKITHATMAYRVRIAFECKDVN